MFSQAAFKRVVRDSGLTKSELATLYGVARQTLYGWLGGQVPRPGSLSDRMAFTITQALCIAIDRKLLPLPALDIEVRRKRVATMRVRMQNLAPAPVK